MSLISCQYENVKDFSAPTAKITNPHSKYLHSKSGALEVTNRSTLYTINDGIDLLNDGMNYIYCRPTANFLESISYKDTLIIPLTSGQIDETDLVSAMDEIAEFAGTNYWADSRTEKQPLIFHMRNLVSSLYSITVEVNFVMEAGQESATIDEYPYQDSWMFGHYINDVSSCNSEFENISACDLFRRDLRRNIVYRNVSAPYYFKEPYVVCYSATDTECEAFGIENLFLNNEYSWGVDMINLGDFVEEDNLYDYLLFSNYEAYSNFSFCLTEVEMNFYYESMEDLALNLVPSPPSTLVIGQVEVGFVFNLFGQDQASHAFQVCLFNRLPVIEEEDKEALPLPN